MFVEYDQKFVFPPLRKSLNNLRTIVTADLASSVRNISHFNLPAVKQLLDDLPTSAPKVPTWCDSVFRSQKIKSKDNDLIITGADKGTTSVVKFRRSLFIMMQ